MLQDRAGSRGGGRAKRLPRIVVDLCKLLQTRTQARPSDVPIASAAGHRIGRRTNRYPNAQHEQTGLPTPPLDSGNLSHCVSPKDWTASVTTSLNLAATATIASNFPAPVVAIAETVATFVTSIGRERLPLRTRPFKIMMLESPYV